MARKAPVLVFEDADITAAVNGVVFAAFIASGQTCVSATRLLVHEAIYDEFMARFVEKVDKITKGMGDRTSNNLYCHPIDFFQL